jgi:hypothetical protein
MGGIAIVCLVGLFLGLWFIQGSDEPALAGWSWIGVAFLALGVIGALWQMRRPVRLELSPEGFQVTGIIGSGLIAWRDVETFFIYSAPPDPDGHGGVAPHAAWRLRETASARASTASHLNRMAGEALDGTAPRTLGRSPENLRDLLESWRVRYS